MLALPLVSASTILTGQERLPYTDGTYINPPAGTYSITQTVNGVTYSNPARINDVWYLNSLVLTNQAPPPTSTPVPTTNPGTENLNYPTPTPTLNPTINPQPSPIVQIIKQLTSNQSSTTYIIVVVIIIGVIVFGLYVSNSNSDSKLKRKMQKQSDWQNPLG